MVYAEHRHPRHFRTRSGRRWQRIQRQGIDRKAIKTFVRHQLTRVGRRHGRALGRVDHATAPHSDHAVMSTCLEHARDRLRALDIRLARHF